MALAPAQPMHTRRSPTSLTSLPDILSALAALQDDESQISASLALLLAAQQPVLDALTRLRNITPPLTELHLDASLLSDTVSRTATTARRVGGRVRQLDEEMRRVRDAADRVAQVMELKSSLASLQSSMESQDWESATRHCARAMALPMDVISGPFAESAVPTADSPLPPVQTLQAAREQLLDVFLRQFKQASQARDAAATSRFFKLFPPIGWEKEGLDAYADFVLDLVQTKSPPSAKTSSPLYFITALTALFESVCNIVDQHHPVVEKYYGRGKMLYVVRRLMQECDRVTKKYLDSWEDERSMKRKLMDASLSTAISPTVRRQPTQSGSIEEDTVDPREIDKVLTEASAMTMRYTAFRRFLYNNLQEYGADGETHPEAGGAEALVPPSPKARPVLTVTEGDASEDDPAMDLIESSGCRKTFGELADTYYIPLEIWYLRSTINQAHRLSTTDQTQVPPTTTVPDLVFYLLKTVLFRILNAGSIVVVRGIFDPLRDVVDRDYAGVIRRKLDEVYRTTSTPAAARGERAERESRLNFIVHLNDLDVSSSHMERLVKDILSSHAIPQSFIEKEQAEARASVSTLLTLVPKFHATLKAGIEQLFNQLMRPRLRTLLSDVYKDVSYVLDEDSYTAAEYQDVVRKRFIRAWETLVDGYKDTLTDANYRILFGLAVDVLMRPWEKFVMSLKFSELGAIRFDRDIRAISSYLSSQTAFGDAREKFTRLQQVSTLLNLDREEDVDEFFSGSGITWKLSLIEARSVAAQKI